jgi:hypothetical protein
MTNNGLYKKYLALIENRKNDNLEAIPNCVFKLNNFNDFVEYKEKTLTNETYKQYCDFYYTNKIEIKKKEWCVDKITKKKTLKIHINQNKIFKYIVDISKNKLDKIDIDYNLFYQYDTYDINNISGTNISDIIKNIKK